MVSWHQKYRHRPYGTTAGCTAYCRQPEYQRPTSYYREVVPYSGTHELLSLIYEVTPAASEFYAYPLYVQLRTAHDSGYCTGINSTCSNGWRMGNRHPPSRIKTRERGSPSESTSRRTVRGTGESSAPTCIQPGRLNEAVNIQTGDGCSWETGLNFDYGSKEPEPSGSGEVGSGTRPWQ